MSQLRGTRIGRHHSIEPLGQWQGRDAGPGATVPCQARVGRMVSQEIEQRERIARTEPGVLNCHARGEWQQGC